MEARNRGDLDQSKLYSLLILGGQIDLYLGKEGLTASSVLCAVQSPGNKLTVGGSEGLKAPGGHWVLQ